MSSSPGLVTVILLMLGQTHGNSVTQMNGQVSHSEGTSVTINCTYSTSGYPNLFWYVQYPGEGPQLLLKAMKANDKGTNKGFEATYNTETTSFHLEKASVQESDSAVYYCALTMGPGCCVSLQSCPTLCDPTDGSPPGSPIPGILQARTLEWVAIAFSNA
uniref:Ig-like domain-containing protein n=1 Tax=Bos mutus grunniens TaxID=30521 RepID=A0A8C0A6Z7_BOSMU